MALVVESGSGTDTTANSYVSVADADAYHTKFGNTDWTSITDTTLKEQALIQATFALDLLYGQRYLSMPLNSVQPLLFPRFVMVINRIQVIQSGRLPNQLKNATAEVALMYINGVNIFPKPNENVGIKQETVKVGDIETSTVYANKKASEQFTDFNKIDLILWPILKRPEGFTPGTFRF